MIPMTDREAVEMMQRCKVEIVSLRRERDHLRPKAEAYDVVAQILSLLPQPSICMGEDVLWTLDKCIKNIEQGLANPVEERS